MKKLDTITKAIANAKEEELNNIINNKDVNILMSNTKDIFYTLLLEELKKSIDSKDYEIVFNFNYSKSKSNDIVFNYYNVIDKLANKSLIQVYTSVNLKTNQCSFNLCTSKDKSIIEKLVTTCNYENYKNKTSRKMHIEYNDIVQELKNTLSVLKS